MVKSITIMICFVFLAPFLRAQDTSIFDLQEPFYLAGESNEDLTPLMAERKSELEFRINNKEAWQMYKKGTIDEFSYFGFKLFDVKNGNLELKDFISELQQYLKKATDEKTNHINHTNTCGRYGVRNH